MMKTNRKWITVLLAGMLASCGGNSDSNSDSNSGDDISPPPTVLNQQQTIASIQTHQDTLQLLHLQTDVSWFEQAPGLVFTGARDNDGDGVADVTFGFGYQCQQSDFDTFNQSPVMPAELSYSELYHHYPQHLLCIPALKDEQALLDHLSQQLSQAQVADLLLLSEDVRTANDNAGDTLLLQRTDIEQFETGKKVVSASPGQILLLGDNTTESLISCAQGDVSLSHVGAVDPNHPRLQKFKLTLEGLANLNTSAIYDDCQITNSAGVNSAIGQHAQVAFNLSEVTPDSNIDFVLKAVNPPDDIIAFTHGDIDGDGRADFITHKDGFISWQQNVGNKIFDVKKDIIEVGFDFGRMLLADMDADGLNDMVVAQDGNIAVYSNDPTHSFNAQVAIHEHLLDGDTLILFDVNGDERPDIVGCVDNYACDKFMVYYNHSIGFSAPEVIMTPDEAIEKILRVDLDQNGVDELILQSNQLILLQHNNQGALTPTVLHQFEIPPSDLDFADFDNDGDLDLFSVVEGSVLLHQNEQSAFEFLRILRPKRSIQYNDGYMSIDQTQKLRVAAQPNGVSMFLLTGILEKLETDQGVNDISDTDVIEHSTIDRQGVSSDAVELMSLLDRSDFDLLNLNQGSPWDLLVRSGNSTDTGGNSTLSWYQLNTQGQVSNPLKIAENKVIHRPDLLLTELNNDGHLDVMLMSDNQMLSWASTDDGITKAPSFSQDVNCPMSLYFTQYVDFDGDGDTDILCAQRYAETQISQFNLYYNNDVQFAAEPVVALKPQLPLWSVKMLDFDGDGDIDIFHRIETATNTGTGADTGTNNTKVTYQLLVNNGAEFDARIMAIYDTSNASYLSDFADLENDGYLDSFNIMDDHIKIYHHTPTGFTTVEFAIPELLVNLSQRLQIQAVDLQGNGHLSLLLMADDFQMNGSAQSTIYVVKNQGQSGFAPPQPLITIFEESVYTIEALPSDINGDGYQDLNIHVSSPLGDKLYSYIHTDNGQYQLLNTVDINAYVDFEHFQLTVLATKDIDRDGKDDLLVQMHSVPFSIYERGSEKAFALFRSAGAAGYEVTLLHSEGEYRRHYYGSHSAGTIMDWDNDNDLDVVLLSYDTLILLDNP